MHRVIRSLGIFIFGLGWTVAASAQTARRPITFEDIISMHRIGDPQISPDGQWIAYTVATPDKDANRLVSDIWVIATNGGEPKQLTRGGTDERPRWSPDGRKIAFVSAPDGTPQVYWISVAGGEASRLTSVSGGAANEIWSPDGKSIAFVERVYPDCGDDACNAKRDTEQEKSKVKARIYTKLLYRHWTQWWDGKRSHLFIVAAPSATSESTPAGTLASVPRDLTPGADYDVPPFNLGNPEAISFSPDSHEIAFTANSDKDEAMSTNGDIFTVAANGDSAPKKITDNPGDDWGPIYSPDGKWIAYRAQFIPGNEADRWRLMLDERASGKRIDLTEHFDAPVDAFEWAPDSQTILFQTEEQGEMPIYSIAAIAGSTPRKVIADGYNDEFEVSRDGRTIIFARSSFTYPPELFAAAADGRGIRQLTHHNGEILARVEMAKTEAFWYAGADGAQVEEFIIRPPNFDASKKYPLLLLAHGGPQVPWSDTWSYRWNPEVMAAPGYVVVMPNFHGSPGYGQKFTEEISKDWGGEPYTDIMDGVDAAIAKYSFIDGSRMGAAGASYGGFMIDWIATHTGRFKCLVSHAGPYDERSMYGSTEELWFMEWEYGGTPWANPELYDKWSSDKNAGALGKFKTPTLVIGGERDFRVPYTQDLEFFTALQRQGVPSKLMIFPDEGHWILKPQNSELWYKTVLDWLATYLK
ncbi:MAG: S9 family peptidase [Candidatus Acidiferrales bacterium]